jgi:hypothetical protein
MSTPLDSTQFESRYFRSKDGLRLHYRDYRTALAHLTVVCLW